MTRGDALESNAEDTGVPSAGESGAARGGTAPFRGVTTGLLFRNPRPHLKSLHAYFPSVVCLASGELVATYMLGEAFEAIDTRVHRSRSADNGNTWHAEGPVASDLEGRSISESARLTAAGADRVVVLLHRHDRTGREQDGLANPENLGFVPTEFALADSADGGRTWSPPVNIRPPIVGPSFELCAPVTLLRDGRWLLPTSTWRGWNGELPNGHRMLAFVSTDGGRSWPGCLNVMHDESNQVVYWESKIVELADDRLLAVAWAYHMGEKVDLPNQYALSSDGGRSWTSPQTTGLIGQTMTPLVLDDGRVLVAYRRMDRPGLWAQIVRLAGERWINDESVPLWGADATGLTATDASMADNFRVLRFGAPCLCRLRDGAVFLAFWCYEDCISVIRWFRFHVD